MNGLDHPILRSVPAARPVTPLGLPWSRVRFFLLVLRPCVLPDRAFPVAGLLFTAYGLYCYLDT